MRARSCGFSAASRASTAIGFSTGCWQLKNSSGLLRGRPPPSRRGITRWGREMAVATFPQHEHKPTIEELVRLAREIPDAALDARWAHFYPELGPADRRRIYLEYAERRRREAEDALQEVEFVTTAYRAATGSDLPNNLPWDEALEAI